MVKAEESNHEFTRIAANETSLWEGGIQAGIRENLSGLTQKKKPAAEAQSYYRTGR
jgi:hypothetical protein